MHEFRCGSIKAASWLNETNGSCPQYNVTLNRLYRLPPDERTKNDNGWRQTSSLRRDDLLIAGEVLRQAFGWICQQTQATSDSANSPIAETNGPRF